MLSPAVRQMFGLSTPQSRVGSLSRSPVEPIITYVPVAPKDAPAPVDIVGVQPDPDQPAAKIDVANISSWPAARLALTNKLWGAGFIFPGGELETLQLARPLGTTADASLLLIGVGSGGPATTVTRNLGTTVTGLDNDPSLLAAARGLVRRARLSKKVTIDSWDPANPVLTRKSHNHCLALQPLNGERPEPILSSLAQALKPGGQLVLTELVANIPLNDDDPEVRRWAELEKRDLANMVPGRSIGRMLGRVGLELRTTEDISSRHLDQAMLGWRVLVKDLHKNKPDTQQAALLVAEAELWLLRRRLIKDGRLQMMRWHAVKRKP